MRRVARFAGEVWLLGTAALAFLLMAMSLAGIRWSRGAMFLGVIAVVAAIVVIIRRGAPFERPRITAANAIDAFTLLLIAGYVRVATLAAPAEADFYGIWGVKAKQFFRMRGIAWRFVLDPINVPSHMDYPILQPLLYDVQALLNGAWPDERWLSLMHIGASIAALLIVRSLLAEEMSKLARAAATLILMPLIFSPFFGLPEGLLVAYGTVGVLFLRRAIRDGDPALVMRGAVHLGLAASCKNEGVSLLVAVAIAVLSTRPRLLPRLWPAVAVILPWMLVRSIYAIPTDLLQSGTFDRLIERAADPLAFLDTVHRNTSFGGPLFWIGVAAACLLGGKRLIREERFLATTIVLQLAFFTAVYLTTPYELPWHLRNSGERILRQVMPLVALLALLITVIRFRAENANATDP